MNETDPRHGTNAGYFAGCRRTCCKAAHAAASRTHRKTRRDRIGYKPRSEYRRPSEKPIPTINMTYERALEIAIEVYDGLSRRKKRRWLK